LSGGRWIRPAAGDRAIFAALPLSPDARAQVEALVERVRAAMPIREADGSEVRPVRWVRTDGLHVTVRFLGPTQPDRLAGIERAVAAAAAATQPIRLRLHGGGGFPHPDRPRTLWLRIDEGEAELAALARRLDDHLEDEHWPREQRPFRAHLTLARSDGVRAGPATLRRLVAEAQDLAAEWIADEFVLFESLTGGGPARYEPLLRAPLAGDIGG
jgi:2'-5' RNA ligase